MNCLIIGSVALKYHLSDIYREPADIDLLVDSEETKKYIINNKEKISEIMSYLGIDYSNLKVNFLPVEDCSNHLVFDLLDNNYDFLNINVATLPQLKLFKLASIPWNLKKHESDLTLLKDVELDVALNKILPVRLAETRTRADIQKNSFFTETVVRYIPHDKLHLYVTPMPAYKLILEDNHYYKGNKNKFNNLNIEKQFCVVAEEIFVFSLERWFIPEFFKNRLAINELCNRFLNDMSTNGPMHYWIFKFMNEGRVKGNPSWISLWLEKNYNYFITSMNPWWAESFHKLPEEFWLELLSGQVDEENNKDIS